MLLSHRGSITATQLLLLHWRESKTSCSPFWRLQHVWTLGLRTYMYEHGLSRLMHDDLHWLTVPQSSPWWSTVVFQHRAPRYLTDYSVCLCLKFLVASIYDPPCVRKCLFHVFTLGSRAFSVAGLTVWNSLPDDLRKPAVDSNIINRTWKHKITGHRASAH